MHISRNVHAGAMPDSVMVVIARIQFVVGRIIIGKYSCARQSVLADHTVQSGFFGIRGHDSNHSALAFDHADYGSFWLDDTAKAFCSWANVHLIGFDTLSNSADGRIFFQHGTNLLEHPPCCLVSNPSLALNLLCGDAATSRIHQV